MSKFEHDIFSRVECDKKRFSREVPKMLINVRWYVFSTLQNCGGMMLMTVEIYMSKCREQLENLTASDYVDYAEQISQK